MAASRLPGLPVKASTIAPLGRTHRIGVNGEGGGAGSTKQGRNTDVWMLLSLSGRTIKPSSVVVTVVSAHLHMPSLISE